MSLNILGIGSDIVKITRIARLWHRFGQNFAAKILSEAEMAELKSTPFVVPFLAKRFAAKEAAVKAFGTGFRDGLAFQHFTVTHTVNGQPVLQFHDAALEFAKRLGVTQTHITLSDEKEYAVAFVLLVAAA
jgi:holo-[acyl-carrier protein] synthase